MDVPPRPGLPAGGYSSHSPSAMGRWVLGAALLWLCTPKKRLPATDAGAHSPWRPSACRRRATPRWNRLEQPCQACATVRCQPAPVSQRLRVCSGPAATVHLYVMSMYYRYVFLKKTGSSLERVSKSRWLMKNPHHRTRSIEYPPTVRRIQRSAPGRGAAASRPTRGHQQRWTGAADACGASLPFSDRSSHAHAHTRIAGGQ